MTNEVQSGLGKNQGSSISFYQFQKLLSSLKTFKLRSWVMPKVQPDISYYEATADDPRPIVDPNLEFEADKTGMIHVRKRTSETEILPGYGTTNFGISAYEPKSLISSNKIILSSSILSAGALIWKFRDVISSQFKTAFTYALLMKEASKR
jgi:hypothetical protein